MFLQFLRVHLVNFALTIYIEVEDLLPFLMIDNVFFLSAEVSIRSECLPAKAYIVLN